MSFHAFYSNPKTYLDHHLASLSQATANIVPASMTQGAAVANAAHGSSVLYTHVANLTLSDVNASTVGKGLCRAARSPSSRTTASPISSTPTSALVVVSAPPTS